MKILLATSNEDKVKEIKQYLSDFEVLALNEVMQSFEIIEDGQSFKQNALIKARAVYEKLSQEQKEEFIVLSDDSGISVKELNYEPGIYSARYSQEGSDKANRLKLINKLKEKNLKQSEAFYTACLGILSKFGEFSVHGFMHGKVIDEQRGENGFGYDFIFIPNSYDKTLSELPKEVKLQISHRSKALELSKVILNNINKKA